MKKFVLIASIMLLVYGNLVAVVPDTVVVTPGLNTLSDAVDNSDNWGKVFKLQRGGLYAIEGTLDAPDSVTGTLYIVGEKGPANERPAIIQLYSSESWLEWQVMLGLDKATHYKFENILFYCYNQEGRNYLGAFDTWKNGSNVEVNNCFFDGSNWAAIFFEADSVNATIRNSIFINSTNKAFFQQGHLYEGWGFVGSTKFGVYNNTMINFGGPGEGFGNRVDTVEYLHNTWYIVDRNLAMDGYMGKINRIFENNILYDVGIRGYVGPRPQWRVHPDSAGYPGDNGDGPPPSPVDSTVGIFDVDSLWVATGDSSFMGAAEDARLIRIRNNLRYTSKLVRDFQKQITPRRYPLFNNRAQEMFATFANKVAEGNIDETVDPNFVKGVPDSAYDPIFKNTIERRNLALRTEEYPVSENWNWGNLSDISASYLLPWPLPVDLKPQAAEAGWGAGTDGYPLGDLNWWGKDIVQQWEQQHLTGVQNKPEVRPLKFALSQNYPNPFNPVTNINYQISRPANVSLIVYDILGQRVKTLVNGVKQAAGLKQVTWDGTNDSGNQVASGLYFYKLVVDNKIVATKKMMLLK